MSEDFYERELESDPIPITRTNFIREIFKLGQDMEFSVETLVVAVELGDNYPKYSLELAHAACCLASKFGEDNRNSYSTNDAVDNCKNHLIVDMECYLFSINKFHIKRNSFFKFLYSFEDNRTLSTQFYFLCFDLCKYNLFVCNPFSIIISVKMLTERDKLASSNRNKLRIFKNKIKTILRVAEYCDVEPSKILQLLINNRQSRPPRKRQI